MSLKNVVVDGCEFSFDPAPVIVDVTVKSTPSTKVKFGGKGAYFKEIEISVSGYAGGGVLDGKNSSVKIQGSSSTMKIENEKAILEGDKVEQITIAGVDQADTSKPKSIKVTVSIGDAGQTKVKAE